VLSSIRPRTPSACELYRAASTGGLARPAFALRATADKLGSLTRGYERAVLRTASPRAPIAKASTA